MDLGIKGKRAIVCASSKGLGRGSAEKLAEAGVHLTLNARTAETLEATAEAIRSRYAVEVKTIAIDITTDEGRAKVLEAEPTRTFWSTTPAVRRRDCGAIGTKSTGWRRSTPTW